VLVIIGLIAGGVLVGQDLIRAAGVLRGFVSVLPFKILLSQWLPNP
jgi:hypothetical protein